MTAASYHEISAWYDYGVRRGATHMIVLCDTLTWSDYPVYVMPGEDPRDTVELFLAFPQTNLMEVYSLRLNKLTQLTEKRAIHYD